MKTWSQVIQGRVMRVRWDYILEKYQRSFKMMGRRGVSDYPSDHFVLQASLIIFPTEAGHHCSGGVLPKKYDLCTEEERRPVASICMH